MEPISEIINKRRKDIEEKWYHRLAVVFWWFWIYVVVGSSIIASTWGLFTGNEWAFRFYGALTLGSFVSGFIVRQVILYIFSIE